MSGPGTSDRTDSPGPDRGPKIWGSGHPCGAGGSDRAEAYEVTEGCPWVELSASTTGAKAFNDPCHPLRRIHFGWAVRDSISHLAQFVRRQGLRVRLAFKFDRLIGAAR